MIDSRIFRRTLKGVEQAVTPSPELPRSLWRYLAAIDGRMSIAEIEKAHPSLVNLHIVIDSLVQHGLIEEVTAAKPAGAVEKVLGITSKLKALMTVRAEEPAATRNVDSFAGSASGTSPKDIQRAAIQGPGKLEKAKQDVTLALTQYLKNDAALVIAKVNRCNTADDLFACVVGCKKIISIYAGPEAAHEFEKRFTYIATM